MFGLERYSNERYWNLDSELDYVARAERLCGEFIEMNNDSIDEIKSDAGHPTIESDREINDKISYMCQRSGDAFNLRIMLSRRVDEIRHEMELINRFNKMKWHQKLVAIYHNLSGRKECAKVDAGQHSTEPLVTRSDIIGQMRQKRPAYAAKWK